MLPGWHRPCSLLFWQAVFCSVGRHGVGVVAVPVRSICFFPLVVVLRLVGALGAATRKTAEIPYMGVGVVGCVAGATAQGAVAGAGGVEQGDAHSVFA